FKDEDFYEAASLHTENFIHCSFAEQLEAVLNRYYKDAETVLILEIEPERLTSELIAEPSTGGEIYPHIYGRINKDAIVKIETRDLRNAG
ncbi:DUF952 domain-containing protein, partial [Clavibacter michiganensis]|uniref:DUF952 domain-containing protein n=1 Tax=Clavibacter michiganensis TaxID=28447 RepID=UPI00292D0EAA